MCSLESFRTITGTAAKTSFGTSPGGEWDAVVELRRPSPRAEAQRRGLLPSVVECAQMRKAVCGATVEARMVHIHGCAVGTAQYRQTRSSSLDICLISVQGCQFLRRRAGAICHCEPTLSFQTRRHTHTHTLKRRRTHSEACSIEMQAAKH